MTKLIRPSLAIFDLDDTFYDYNKRNDIASLGLIHAMCDYSGISETLVSKALENGRVTVKNRLGKSASSHSRLLYISEAFRELSLLPDVDEFISLEEVFWGTFLSEIELYPGVKQTLNSLKNLNVGLVLVTDLTSNIQYKKISKLGLNGYFDFILTSEEAGGDKQTNRPFEILESQMGALMQSTWFFGDSDFDFPHSADYPRTFFKKVQKPGLSATQQGYEYGDYASLGALIQQLSN